jgi:hypothetical protein
VSPQATAAIAFPIDKPSDSPMHLKTKPTLLATFALAIVAGAAHAGAVTENFDGTAVGSLPAGWTVPPNAATSGEVRAGVGLGGSNGLAVGNNGSGNDGVIDNLKSAPLAAPAGQPSTGATSNVFESSYWFRTASTTLDSDFRFRSESWSANPSIGRTTFLGFQVSGTTLVATAFDTLGGEIFNEYSVATGLAWGDWYHVTTKIVFGPGNNDDLVSYLIQDAADNVVGSLSGIQTWEGSYGPQAVDRIQFTARGACPSGCVGGRDVAFVDDVTIGTVPEPASLALVGMALAGAGLARRRSSKR